MSRRRTAPTSRSGAQRRGATSVNLVLVGAAAVTFGVLLLAVAYNATRRLPFVSTYDISVDIPSAAGVNVAAEVRIGGARVGQVQKILAEEGPGGRPYARLKVTLDADRRPLPADTRAEVRTKSLLGAKYLALVPGHSERGIPAGGRLPLGQTDPGFDLNDAFKIFDRQTTRGIRGTVGGLGGALAGRGAALNQAVGSGAHLVAPATRVLDALAGPQADLRGLVRGAAAIGGALAPVARPLAGFVAGADRTLAAVDREGAPLQTALQRLPHAETSATAALRRTGTVLGDANALLRDLRPGTRGLPRTARRLNTVLRTATPALRPAAGLPVVARLLAGPLGTLARRAAPLTQAVARLGGVTRALRTTMGTLLPAQEVCNVAGLWARNLSSAISEGNSAGNWFRASVQTNYGELIQNTVPQSGLNANPNPIVDAQECEAGTEPYRFGVRIGNPAGRQTTDVEHTSAGVAVTAEARRAGLLDREPGTP